MSIRLREAQREVLEFKGGKMGIAAVPGSGKTTTLVELAVKLIREDLKPGERVLLVTYQNAAVGNLSARLSHRLEEEDLLPTGFEVRTLHSLSNVILKSNPALTATSTEFSILDEPRKRKTLDKAVDLWMNQNTEIYTALLPQDSHYYRNKFKKEIQEVAQVMIRTAKNYRVTADRLAEFIAADPDGKSSDLHVIGSQLFDLYQQQVRSMGALDFDDLIRLAVDTVSENPEVADQYRSRWPFILEDEAQDSVPLQEELLSILTEGGSWVRVGDPNQSIMGTFTSAEPRFLNEFLDRDDVHTVELNQAGRSSPKIIRMANELVRWVSEEHSNEDVRKSAFRKQFVQPTPPGDPQPNPPDDQSKIQLTTFQSRESQYEFIAQRADVINRGYPDKTVAILVPTNWVGSNIGEKMLARNIEFDERLRTDRKSKGVADVLLKVLKFLADPSHEGKLHEAFDALFAGGIAPAAELDQQAWHDLVRATGHESAVYPLPGRPREWSDKDEETFAQFRKWLKASRLPIDQLIMTISDDAFEGDDLVVAHRVARFALTQAETYPEMHLPQLVDELDFSHRQGRINLGAAATGYEPDASLITLMTMHSAKGLEWDFVFAVDVDMWRFHSSPSDSFQSEFGFLPGNPQAEVAAKLDMLLKGTKQERSSLEQARVDVIAEDYRLLYVLITRARQYLMLACGATKKTKKGESEVEQAEGFRVLQPFDETA